MKITQAEKEAILRNDKRNASTFAQFANSEANEIRGRHEAREKATVTGSEAATQYPRLPGGPWASDYAQVPPEEPLGEDIGAAPIVGELHEQCASSNADVPVEGGANRDKFEKPPSNLSDELGNPTAKCTSAVPVAQAAAAPSASPFVDVEQAAANPKPNRKRRL